MLIFVTGFSMAVLFVLALLAVMTVFKKPFGGSLIIAFGLTVCTEAVLLNVLSLFSFVSAWGLWMGQGIIGLGLLSLIKDHLGSRINGLRIALSQFKTQLGAANWLLAAIIPLAALLLVVALLFPPNNWDSMTYHMARVVYWLQYGSVDYYQTAIPRQNFMTPGAEYLILVPQGMSRSDVFANLVQFSAWIITICALPTILRGYLVPRRYLPWAVVFVATIPMAVLQATSTQNDLVAACLTLGILYSLLPFMHKQSLQIRPFHSVFILAGLTAAAYLVKPTSLLAAFPFILFALLRFMKRQAGGWNMRRAGRVLLMLLLFILIAAVICGPDIYRKQKYAGSFTGNFGVVYPLAGDWGAKIVNAFSGISINTFFHGSIYSRLIQPMAHLSRAGSSFAPHHSPFVVQEDMIGYVLQTAGMAVMFIMLLLPAKRKKTFFMLFLASWLVFHFTIRPQPWLSRLQLPLFFVLPLGFGLFNARPVKLLEKTLLRILLLVCLLGIPYSYYTAAKNPSRPLKALWKEGLWGERPKWYYANRDLSLDHRRVLSFCREANVRKVGLIVDGDAYDYPLSWRLYLSGIHVDHVLPADELQGYGLIYATVPVSLPSKWVLYQPGIYVSRELSKPR